VIVSDSESSSGSETEVDESLIFVRSHHRLISPPFVRMDLSSIEDNTSISSESSISSVTAISSISSVSSSPSSSSSYSSSSAIRANPLEKKDRSQDTDEMQIDQALHHLPLPSSSLSSVRVTPTSHTAPFARYVPLDLSFDNCSQTSTTSTTILTTSGASNSSSIQSHSSVINFALDDDDNIADSSCRQSICPRIGNAITSSTTITTNDIHLQSNSLLPNSLLSLANERSSSKFTPIQKSYHNLMDYMEDQPKEHYLLDIPNSKIPIYFNYKVRRSVQSNGLLLQTFKSFMNHFAKLFIEAAKDEIRSLAWFHHFFYQIPTRFLSKPDSEAITAMQNFVQHDYIPSFPAILLHAAESIDPILPKYDNVELQKIAEATFQFENGTISKASSKLEENVIAPLTPEVMDLLKMLFPASNQHYDFGVKPDIFQGFPSLQDNLKMNKSTKCKVPIPQTSAVVKIIQSLPNGIAPGPSGWSYELLKQATSDSKIADQCYFNLFLSVFVSETLAGRNFVPEIFTCSTLVPMKKPSPQLAIRSNCD